MTRVSRAMMTPAVGSDDLQPPTVPRGQTMFQFYVLWPNGRGYTKTLPSLGAVTDEIGQVAQTDDEPTVMTITFLDPDVSAAGPEIKFDGEGVTEVVEAAGAHHSIPGNDYPKLRD